MFELKREPWHAAHAMASDRDGAQEEVVVVDKIPETRPEYELPCIDCGLLTGNWCDSCEKIMLDAEVKREAEQAKAQSTREQQQAAAQSTENGAKQMAEIMKVVTTAMSGPKEVKIVSQPREVIINHKGDNGSPA